MSPAKGSRTIAKITVKGYDDRQHDEDPTSSSKVKLKKRKMSDLGPQWSKVELMRFYEAYHRHGKNWKKVSATVGGKSADAVKALYNENKTFLSLPEREGTAMGFVALVTGHHNVLEELPSPKESDQTVRASGKIRKRGEALQQKENEAPHPHHSYQQRRASGFSSSFKKKYYGDLVKSIRRHPSGIRTPRVPVIVSADMHATDDAAPEMKYAANSSEKDNKQINNDQTIFAMDGCSPDGSSGIKKSTKVFQGQTFLETKGIGDTNISPTQQRLKKRRIDQSMNQGRTSKDELETTMVAKEGNKLPDCQGLTELFSPDEILVLDVLESLVTVPSKVLQPKINIPLDTLGNNDSALSDIMEEGLSVVQSKQGKRPGECIASKTRKKRSKNLLAEEVPAGEPNISGNNLVMQEECQVDATNCQSLNSEPERGPIDLPESTANMCTETPDVPTQIKPEINMSRRSKRKSESRCERKYVSCPEGASNLQARRLLHCLSSESLRRWCTYEWFYSAVDYPWFMNNEFVNYLNFAKLSHLSRLTRSEWSTIRSSLGKPRRFSDNFLKVEKEKVEDYRKNVRQYYAQLSDGLRDSLPADLARPFSVGQQVIVRHPSTRELCDGEVLMIKQDCYKIQFDRPDLGDDIVKDIDCMPVNLSDNLPDDLKKRSSLSNDALNRLQIEHTPKLTPKENWDHMMNGFSISKSSKTLHITSDELLQVSAVDSERLPNNSTSGRYTPLPSLQCADNSVQSRGCSNNSNGHNDELDSFITSFVQRTESETKLVVDGAMQATNCANLESELPCKLIFNCIGTVLSIKQLSESRHPPASIAGVLERASSMLRPSCSENLSIYNDIESCISIIKNQILALVPATSMLPM